MAVYRTALIATLLTGFLVGGLTEGRAQGYIGRTPNTRTFTGTWNLQDQVTWSPIQSGVYCLQSTPGLQVLGSEAEFQTYWARTTGQLPTTTPKGIDWLKNKVVAIHLGNRPSGGFSVVVRGIEKHGMIATVHAVELAPVPGQWVSEARTSPYILVAVDRSAHKLELDLSKQVNAITGGISIYGDQAIGIGPSYNQDGNPAYVDPANQIFFTGIGSGDDSGYDGSGIYQLGNEDEWNRYVRAVTGNTFPSNCDWSQYKMVAVHLGNRPTSGYSVRIATVEKRGPNAVVHAIEQTPTAGAVVRKRPTYPYAVIRIPRNVAEVTLDLSKRDGQNGVRIYGGRG